MTDFFKALLFNQNYPLIYQSVLFIAVFTLFYGLYLIFAPKTKVRNILLMIFSLYFYYKISGMYVLLLIGIAGSDFLIGRAMGQATSQKTKKSLVILSVLIDLGILVFFKYTNFLLSGIFGIFHEPAPWMIDVLMPIGISYFIFKTLTYTLDIYRENIEKPEKSFWNYLLYLSFFPNIISGPISRAADLLPQINARFNLDKEMIGKGLFLIMTGVFKKIVIADVLAVNLVDRVFDSSEYFNGFEILMASYAYTVQLYFDFSGYTDMVIGLAFLLGFSVLPNFNKPFLAQNVSDFWRRWHMTLSSWLRDYLFTPLSLNLRKAQTTGLVLAILVTFILCGFWHDAKFTFIIWGTLHAVAMAWDIITNKRRAKFKKKNKGLWYKIISVFITFHFIVLSFIVFRARDLETAWYLIKKIFTTTDFSLAVPWMNLYIYPFVIMIVGLLLHYTPLKWTTKLQEVFVKTHWTLKALALVLAIFLIYQAYSTEAQAFIYLEF